MINIFTFPIEHGGTEFIAHQLATKLAEKGNFVCIATRREENLPIIELRHNNYYVYRLPRMKIPILGSLLYLFSVFCLTMQLKPDVILDLGLHGNGLFSRIFMRKPYIVWGRGSDVYNIKTHIQRILVKLILKETSLILVLSKNMEKHLMNISNRKPIILPNGIDIAEFQKNMRKMLGKRFGRKQILFVGNIRPVKGVEYLINAMPKILEEEPDTCLVLVGSYPQTFIQKIPKNLKNKVMLTGFINHQEVPAYMKGSDVFVLPSLSEGFPNVLLEAMAAGLPIVATNVGGIPEIVTDGENGFLTESKNSKQLAEKILLLLKDESLRRRISENNLIKVRKYDISRVLFKLETYIKYVIRSKL